MHKETSIRFHGVTKVYKLYPDPLTMTLDVLGVFRLPFLKRRNYQEFTALKDIDLEVKKGQRIGIVGRNGAGKTTSFRMVTGLIKPNSGQVFLADTDVTYWPMCR